MSDVGPCSECGRCLPGLKMAQEEHENACNDADPCDGCEGICCDICDETEPGTMAMSGECVGCSRRDGFPDEPPRAAYPAPFGRDGRLRDSQVRRRAP